MAITQAQFDALVNELEDFSKKHPESYRLRVALFAALGYAYIFLVLVGLLTLVGLLVLLVVFSHRINALMVKLGILLIIPVWMIMRSLWVTFPPPQGLKLDRHEVPHLFNLVDDLTAQLQAPQFHNILLTQEFNAAVDQIPRLGVLGYSENYLILGLPLMQSLSLEQLKAVLAHELVHLSNRQSRSTAWIYRIRKTWMQIYERLHQNDQHETSALFNRFFQWYWPAFNAYSFILARMNEYEADRYAAQLAGSRHVAEALVNTKVKARFLESSFWPPIYEKVGLQADPPDHVYSSMLSALHCPIAEAQIDQWLKQALTQKTNNSDTHPCLSDRLKSLGYSLTQAQKLSQPDVKISAAEQLLRDNLQQFTTQLDQDWKAATSTAWRQRYAALKEIQDKLQVLEQSAQEHSLSEQDIWEQAYYTFELRGGEAAIPLLQDVLKIQPNHAAANYTLGQALLQKDDVAGIAYLETAMTQEVNWVIEGCELIYRFYWQRGQTEEAQEYLQRAEQHGQILLNARQERVGVSDRDQFKPHTLTALEVNQFKQQLAIYPQIKKVYLVERVVTYLPEKRSLILGIVRKQFLIESGYADQKLIELLTTNLQPPAQTYIVILNHWKLSHLRKKIRQIDQSLILQR
jgi:Zn-dependent protease with chaperone function